MTVKPQQEISKTVHLPNSLKMLDVYFGEITFTFRETTFTFGGITFTLGYSRSEINLQKHEK